MWSHVETEMEEEGYWGEQHGAGGEEPVLHLTMSDIRRLGTGSLVLLSFIIAIAFCRGSGKGSTGKRSSFPVEAVDGLADGFDVDIDSTDVESESLNSSSTKAKWKSRSYSGGVSASPTPAVGASSLKSSSVTLSCVPFDCPTGRRAAAMAVTDAGGVYLHGGETEKRLLNEFSVYQQKDVTWDHDIDEPVADSAADAAPAAQMIPGSRAHHTLVPCGEYLVLYGGECDPQECRSSVTDPGLYLFHAPSHQWVRFDVSQRSDAEEAQPSGRLGHTMCVRAGHELVVFGGRGGEDGRIIYDDVWTFDLLQFSGDDEEITGPAGGDNDDKPVKWAQQQVDTSSHGPVPRYDHCATVIGGVTVEDSDKSGLSSNERMVVMGGTDAAGTASLVAPGQIEVLDLDTWKWNTVATTGCGPRAAGGMSSHTLPTPNWDSILVVGLNPAVPGIFNELFALDMGQRSPTWTRLCIDWHGDWTMIPGRRMGFGSAIDCANSMVFVFGGENDSGMLHDSLLAIDVAELVGVDIKGTAADRAGVEGGASNGWSSADAEKPITVGSLREQIASGRYCSKPPATTVALSSDARPSW